MAISFEGLEGIFKRLDDLANVEGQKEVVGQACALVEKSAKEKAPKQTGELRRSITSKIETEGDSIVGVVYTPLMYAPYIEYGTGLFAEQQGRTDVPWNYQDDEGNWHSTSGIHPQPFLRPALQENREAVLRIIKGVVKND